MIMKYDLWRLVLDKKVVSYKRQLGINFKNPFRLAGDATQIHFMMFISRCLKLTSEREICNQCAALKYYCSER